MRIKSYFANTVDAALEKARQEFGPDAVLLKAQCTDGAAAGLGRYEVIAGVRPEPAAISLVKKQEHAEVEALRPALLRSHIEPELAEEMLASIECAIRNGGLSRGADWALRKELECRVNVAPSIGVGGSAPAIAALVGPPGVGKTSAIWKLAIRELSHRSVEVIAVRPGPEDLALMQRYTSVLNCTVKTVNDASELLHLMLDRPTAAVTLIDTPGAASPDAAEEIAAMLRPYRNVETHLVATAASTTGEIWDAVNLFQCCRPDKLLITHLDLAESVGPAFSMAVRTGTPISFLSSGPRIPDDLRPASAAELAERAA
jgi:flagellar biosynthesis protein FlhF